MTKSAIKKITGSEYVAQNFWGSLWRLEKVPFLLKISVYMEKCFQGAWNFWADEKKILQVAHKIPKLTFFFSYLYRWVDEKSEVRK